MPPLTGTSLYTRMCAFDHGDAERNALMAHVWSSTPWMLNTKTGSMADPEGIVAWQRIRAWCENNIGDEAFPIHGRDGQWQFGGATVFGWTWVGFATEDQMRRFMAAFPECEPTDDER